MNKEFEINSKEFERKMDKGISVTVNYFKGHWIDYLLMFFICLCLGAFDVFIIRKSDNFLKPEYWYHVATRLAAYILASVLGIRIRYSKAKDSNEALKEALIKNKELKGKRRTDFFDFINKLNLCIKKETWKYKINRKIKNLEKHSKVADIKLFNKDNNIKSKYSKKKIELEYLKSDEYIENHIDYLDIKYYKIYEHDFDITESKESEYLVYKTRKNVEKSSFLMISQMALTTMIIALILGSLKISFDEALASERAVAIFSIIINSIMDIGITLWKFVSGMRSADKLVETEDLRVTLDQNLILEKYLEEKEKNN